jgi:hypothetical protein
MMPMAAGIFRDQFHDLPQIIGADHPGVAVDAQ